MLMLVVTMFTALLSLTAASCPCPAQDPAAEVCGSDQRTYRSQCDLRCDNQGVLLAHPGPCSAGETAAPGRLDDAQLPGGRDLHRRRRSASEEKRKWQECEKERQCHQATCSQCGGDDGNCKVMCWNNCECACGGYARGGMDHRLWRECYTQCPGKYWECLGNCGGDECRGSCWLDLKKCDCECVQRAGNQSSAASTTTGTTSAPSTIGAPSTTSTTSASAPSTTSAPSSTSTKRAPSTTSTTSAPSTAAAVTPVEPPRSPPAPVCEGWGCALLLVLACALVCVGAALCARTRAPASAVCCFIGYAPGAVAQPAPHPQTSTNGDVELLPISKPPVERDAFDMPLHSRNVFDLKTDTFVSQRTLDS